MISNLRRLIPVEFVVVCPLKLVLHWHIVMIRIVWFVIEVRIATIKLDIAVHVCGNFLRENLCLHLLERCKDSMLPFLFQAFVLASPIQIPIMDLHFLYQRVNSELEEPPLVLFIRGESVRHSLEINQIVSVHVTPCFGVWSRRRRWVKFHLINAHLIVLCLELLEVYSFLSQA